MISHTDEKKRLQQELIAGELMKVMGQRSSSKEASFRLRTEQWVSESKRKIISGYRDNMCKGPEPKGMWHIRGTESKRAWPEVREPEENGR